jgi:hypothetical protein
MGAGGDALRQRNYVILALLAVTVVGGGFLLYPRQESEPVFEVQINAVDPDDLGVDEWLEDFGSLCAFVEDSYPYIELKERTHGYNWMDLREGFEERIRAASDNEGFLFVIMEAVEALQNRHTWVVRPREVQEYSTRFSDSYPMNEVFCAEVVDSASGWYGTYNRVTASRYNTRFDVRIYYDRGRYILTDSYARPLTDIGTEVTKVNGVPVDEAVKTCYEKDYLDWDYVREKPFLWTIAPYHFGGDAVFTVMGPTGLETDVTFQPTTGSPDFSHLYPRASLTFERYEELGVGYMYVGTFEPSTIEPQYHRILSFLEEIEGYGSLIIDIRGNTGGAFRPWIEGIVGPLLQEDALHEYYLAYRSDGYVRQFHAGELDHKEEVPKDHFDHLPPEVLGKGYEVYNFSSTYTATHAADFDGEIILLTDNVVYSAAEGFTNFCKQTGFAKIYGTASGGDGFFVWPAYFVLPNSKLVVTTSSSMSLDRKGRANEEARTQPDVLHETAFMALDELINFVLQDITQGE